jgi:hypothetical protein
MTFIQVSKRGDPSPILLVGIEFDVTYGEKSPDTPGKEQIGPVL